VAGGETDFPKPTANHHLHGERPDRKRDATSFEFFASLFADDCAILFESHRDMVIGMDYMYKYFLKFGLEIHLDRGTAKSKTEAMFFPKPRCDDSTTPPHELISPYFISAAIASSHHAEIAVLSPTVPVIEVCPQLEVINARAGRKAIRIISYSLLLRSWRLLTYF
jgi:hypothetical protein